jgi:hypothetical protein
MKTHRLILIAIFLILTKYSFSQSVDVSENDSFTIRGIVIDHKTKETIPAVLVTLFFDNNHYVSCLCDLDGKFILNVPEKEKVYKESYLEFLMFTYCPVIISGDLRNIDHLDIKMDFDPSSKIKKEEFFELCKERYNYNE